MGEKRDGLPGLAGERRRREKWPTTTTTNKIAKALIWGTWGITIPTIIILGIIKVYLPAPTPNCQAIIDSLAMGKEWQTVPDVEIPNRKLSGPGHATAIAFQNWVRSISWEAYRPRRLGPPDPKNQNHLWQTK